MGKIFGEISWSFILAVVVSMGLLIGIIDISNKIERIEELEHLLSETQLQTSKNIQEINERLDKLDNKVFRRARKISINYTNEVIRHTDLDKFCLAKNVYHEAKGEGDLGMFAVAQVTVNRLYHGQWGRSICDVVMSHKQFSWANNRSIRWKHPGGKSWERAKEIAEEVLSRGLRVPALNNALFYHATYVNPRWASNKYYVAQIGQHIFYHNAL
jgi:spore germination cell wall hydrolase CwlJ-like protein